MGATEPAAAQDLETLREGAGFIADSVSDLERRLATLRAQREILHARIASAGQDMRMFKLQLRQARREFEAARGRYVAHAVQTYKDRSRSGLALLLSTTDVGDLQTLAAFSKETAEEQSTALGDLARSRQVVLAARLRLDDRVAQLVRDRRSIKQVLAQTRHTLERRRENLARLRQEIHRLERAARRGARHSAAELPFDVLAFDPRFYTTGVSFEGVASWYGPGFAGEPTATGDTFDPNLMTAASLQLPLGTWLYVTYRGEGVIVLVNDRGPYVDGRILDLSRAAAHRIGITGLGWVRAEILLERDRLHPKDVIQTPSRAAGAASAP